VESDPNAKPVIKELKADFEAIKSSLEARKAAKKGN
jgi:hypothetical protein